jgi:hypothetical protein
MSHSNGTRRPSGRGTRPWLHKSLAASQDALSRRSARRIGELLDAHLPVDGLARLRARIRDAAASRLRELPDLWAARVPDLPGPVLQTGAARIEDVLQDFLPVEDLDAWAAVPPSPPEPAPIARRSRTWAEARGQNAALRAALLDVRARIVPTRRAIPSPSPDGGLPPLVPREPAESHLIAAITGARTQIEGLPSKIRSTHPSVTGAVLFALEDEARALLARLADGPRDDGVDDGTMAGT